MWCRVSQIGLIYYPLIFLLIRLVVSARHNNEEKCEGIEKQCLTVNSTSKTTEKQKNGPLMSSSPLAQKTLMPYLLFFCFVVYTGGRGRHI